jgi:rubrerythrin
MQMNTPNLLDAVRVVKENERIATETYANAARRIPATRTLFEQLSEFEKFHYERLTALEKSLQEKGGFIDYEGKKFVLPPRLEVKFAEVPDQQSIMQVISEAINIERVAQKAYADLAAQLTDPLGHKMFITLSEEEHNHFFILLDAYWSLNETGVWKGSDQ